MDSMLNTGILPAVWDTDTSWLSSGDEWSNPSGKLHGIPTGVIHVDSPFLWAGWPASDGVADLMSMIVDPSCG